MIIGTAGHIDHGKSALVTALTGRPMDRLAEERRRGITIDLNFAPLALASGAIAGIVDVPGHEDFVRTMVAGASGIDLVLLVVAADDGVMPQTREHLAIVEQLGVPAGIPVITKADLADPDWLELVTGDVRDLVAGSPVRFAEPIAVSAVTGAGLAALRSAIEAAAAAASPRSAADLARVPVDRVFSVAGTGTVVTGTAWSGSLAVGDPVLLLPGGMESRVRSIEQFGAPTAASTPGARVAIGLAGVPRESVGRGMVLVQPGRGWAESTVLDVRAGLLPGAPRPLTPRTRVRVHLGTAEVIGRAWPAGAIEPGGHGLVRLRLEAPIVARGGDRFVLRSYSPVDTIGGGEVLDPDPPPGRAAWEATLGAADRWARLPALVARRRGGLPRVAVPVALGVPPGDLSQQRVRHAGLVDVGGVLHPRSALDAAAAEAGALVRGHHRQFPAEPGLPLETLRQQVRGAAPLVAAAVERLLADGSLEPVDGRVRVAGFRPALAGGDGAVDRVVAAVEAAGLQPPSVAELAAQGMPDAAAALRLAAADGRVVAVERDRYFSSAALAGFRAAVLELGGSGPISPAALRDRLGLTRKYLIPLLEWSDRAGLTVRRGDTRELGPKAR